MNCFAKYKRSTRLLAALLSAGSLVAVSHAQTTGPLLRVAVPFDFENGSHRFAAGVYFVRLESDHRLVLEGTNARFVTATVPDESLKAATKSSVVFRRYGDRYFLREVWVAGRNTHVHCPATKTEKQVEIALKGQNKPGVMIAVLDGPK